MKKIYAIISGIFLVGCMSAGFSSRLEEAVQEERNSVNIAEITSFEWEHLRILHPYESRSLFGEKLEQKSTDDCLWVFAKADKIVERFSIARDSVECKKLPTKTFSRGETLFLIRDGALIERKKFTLPKKK